MPDVWLANYSSCTQLYQDIIEQINDRNVEARAGANVSNMNVLIKKDLLNLKTMLAKLKHDLQNSLKYHNITNGELDRRQNLLDTLTTKVRNASETADLGPNSPRSELYAHEREELLSTRAQSRGSSSGNPWLEKEERAAALKAEQLRRQHLVVGKEQGHKSQPDVRKRPKKIGINNGSEQDLTDIAFNPDDRQRDEERSSREPSVGDTSQTTSTIRKVIHSICCFSPCLQS